MKLRQQDPDQKESGDVVDTVRRMQYSRHEARLLAMTGMGKGQHGE